MKYSNLLCILLSLLLSSPVFAGYVIIDGKKIEVIDRGEQLYKLIPLRSMEFSTVEKICKPWMSENGVLTHEKKRSAIIAYDYPDIIERIQKFLKDTDRERVNIRVEVEFDNVHGGDRVEWNRKRDTEGTITIRGGQHQIPKGINIELPINQSSSGSRNSIQMLMTQSGLPASLWVGENSVHPQWLNNMIGTKEVTYQDGRTVTISEGIDTELLFVDVGAKLMVRPRYLDGGLIEVEVYPEISYKNRKGGQESIEVESLKTRVVVREGSRINIGGMVNSKLDSYKNIFGKKLYKRVNGRNVLNMYLRATVVKPQRKTRRR